MVYLVPATKIGAEMGNTRALNVFLLGFLSYFLEIKNETWLANIKEKIPLRFIESSIRAFGRGAEYAEKMTGKNKEAKG
jgi:indolepyruvate ferredoxin oxidoreductase beta subunit